MDSTTPLVTSDVESYTEQDEKSVTSVAKKYDCCDPRGSIHRFIVLAFMCFLGFGSYFCYDNPSALENHIMTDMKITASEYSALYSLYSWPNVVLCFLGGFLIDRVFGIRLGAIIFSLFILIGQIIFGAGALLNRFWLMEVGRFVFGIGGESLAVAQNAYAVRWFKGKELNMVFGLQLSFARVGSTVNFNVMLPIYDMVNKNYSGYECLGIVLLIAAFTCVFSQICALILGIFDKRADRVLKLSGSSDEKISLRDVKDFPASFWLLCIICVAYYVTIFPLVGFGTVFFMRKFSFSHTEANAVNSIIYIISAGASPIFGIMVDKLGRNLSWVFGAIILTLICHGILAFTFLNPWVAMVFIGIGYSLLACGLWPMVALVVPEHQLGTAYGVMQAVQNLGLGVVMLLAGIIVDQSGYLMCEVFYLAWLCVCLGTCVILFVINAKNDGPLDLTLAERTRREEMIHSELQQEKASEYISSGSTAHDLLQPRSDFSLRNRYLSRIGALLPSHFDISTCALKYRTGLK